MIRQPQRRLYFESETEEFYWERSAEEAAALADKLGFRQYGWDELQPAGVADDGPLRELPSSDREPESRSGGTACRDKDSLQ